MRDFLTLIVIPMIVAFCITICLIRKNHKIANSHKLDDRIKKTTQRPRVIRDKNSKLNHINKLMLPENTESFNNDMAYFFKSSL